MHASPARTHEGEYLESKKRRCAIGRSTSFGTSTRTRGGYFLESKKRARVTAITRRRPAISEQYARAREGGILSVQKRGVQGPGLNVPRAYVREGSLFLAGHWVPVRFPGRFRRLRDIRLPALNGRHTHHRLANRVHPERQAHPAQRLDLLRFYPAPGEGDELVLVEEHVRHRAPVATGQAYTQHPFGRSMTCRP
jgi:hypothetical protein